MPYSEAQLKYMCECTQYWSTSSCWQGVYEKIQVQVEETINILRFLINKNMTHQGIEPWTYWLRVSRSSCPLCPHSVIQYTRLCENCPLCPLFPRCLIKTAANCTKTRPLKMSGK